MGTDAALQRELEIHRMVGSKLAQLGLKDHDLGEITAGLGDLYGAFEEGKRLIERFIRVNNDPEAAADILVDFRVELMHIQDHIRSLKRPLEGFIDSLYGDDTDGQ